MNKRLRFGLLKFDSTTSYFGICYKCASVILFDRTRLNDFYAFDGLFIFFIFRVKR